MKYLPTKPNGMYSKSLIFGKFESVYRMWAINLLLVCCVSNMWITQRGYIAMLNVPTQKNEKVKIEEDRITENEKTTVIVRKSEKVKIGEDRITENEKTTVIVRESEVEGHYEDSLYSYMLWYLKFREGFMANIYRCPAGFKTVAYGHNLDAHGKKYIGKTIDDGEVTYREATELLYGDFERQYAIIKAEFPSMSKAKLYAVTGLALNCGLAKIKYIRGVPKNGLSRFWVSLKNGRTPNFGLYVKYKTPNGAIVVSDLLVKSRKFEEDLFVGNYEVVSRKANIFKKIIIKRDINAKY